MKKFIFLSFTLIFLQIFKSFSADFSDLKPVVSSINAQKSSENKITLTWKLPEDFNAASVAVFRGASGIYDFSQILLMQPVAELSAKSSSYIDTLENYGEYYYAVIARGKDGNLFDAVIPGINSTIRAAILEQENGKNPKPEGNALKNQEYQPSFLRNLPLPYLDLAIETGKKPSLLSEDSLCAAKELSGKYYGRKPPLKSPYVFEEDLVCKMNGDDYYLFQSLKKYFVKKDYENSARDLKIFLSVNRESETAARAKFYLAESEYYSGNYKNALQIFLSLDDIFPSLSKSWADSALDQYEIPRK